MRIRYQIIIALSIAALAFMFGRMSVKPKQIDTTFSKKLELIDSIKTAEEKKRIAAIDSAVNSERKSQKNRKYSIKQAQSKVNKAVLKYDGDSIHTAACDSMKSAYSQLTDSLYKQNEVCENINALLQQKTDILEDAVSRKDTVIRAYSVTVDKLNRQIAKKYSRLGFGFTGGYGFYINGKSNYFIGIGIMYRIF